LAAHDAALARQVDADAVRSSKALWAAVEVTGEARWIGSQTWQPIDTQPHRLPAGGTATAGASRPAHERRSGRRRGNRSAGQGFSCDCEALP